MAPASRPFLLPAGPVRARSGFSLVELLVALAFLGVLVGGLAQVLQGALGGFALVHERLATQRTLRWAFSGMEHDLRMMGFLFPPPWLRAMPVAASADPAVQSAFMLMPGQPLAKVRAGAFVPLDPGDDPLEPPGGRADALSFIMDQPLPAEGALATAIPGPLAGPAAVVTVRLDRPWTLVPGDLLWVEGDRFECVQVLEEVALREGVPGAIAVGPARAGLAFTSAHAAGARVGLVKPLRVVLLAVVYLPLAGADRLVPCLVRLEAAYRADQAVPPWAQVLGQPGALPANAMILAEQVTGLRVDLSLDGQWPGIRGADYPATVARLNEAIRSRSGPAEGATDPGNPLWFRQVPAVLSLTLTTRQPGHPAHHDTLRWVVRPRNFGLEPTP